MTLVPTERCGHPNGWVCPTCKETDVTEDCERSYRSPNNPDVLWVCIFPKGHEGLCDWFEHVEFSATDEDFTEFVGQVLEQLKAPGTPIDLTEGCIHI